jgi:SAM-dependent methyltransferase
MRSLTACLILTLLLASAIRAEDPLDVKGKLTRNDPRDRVTQGPGKVHEVKLDAGTPYIIHLHARFFAAFLRLEDDAGKEVARSDDRGPATDARIIYKVTRGGTYRIVVATVGGKLEREGAYTLTVRLFKESERDDRTHHRVIHVPTPDSVVEKMLEMARVTKDDVVYDLGCGDGRIVAIAAKKYGARGVGVDIDPVRIKESLDTIKRYGVEDLVDIRHGEALKVKDLDRATVITLYMLPEFMKELEPIVNNTLRPGARIVAHDYPFPNWKADQVVKFQGAHRQHTLYLWTVKEEGPIYDKVPGRKLEAILGSLKVAYKKVEMEGGVAYDYESNNHKVRLVSLGRDLMIDARFKKLPLEDVNQYNLNRKFIRCVGYKVEGKEYTALEASLDCAGGVSDAIIRHFLRSFDEEVKQFAQFVQGK